MKPTKNPLIDKLLKLKYIINDWYNTYGEDTSADKAYVIGLISDIRHNSVKFTKLCKEDFEKCNGLWRRYEGK